MCFIFFRESWIECAIREVHEETGLQLKDVRYYTVVNAVEMDKDYHYITIFMKGSCNQEPENLEPEKCEGKVPISTDLTKKF